ncbi:uncharacterized protein LOC134536427 [Bacillus rossius redtenbacheri]|uniref:uncharacterized protein LOC134536427 n=1 Tax=Bacillus rossius redtenbacheri TaxID=93214 RepID=UPI002FDD7D65
MPKPITVLPLKTGNSTSPIAFAPQAKADLLAATLEQAFRPNTAPSSQKHTETVHQHLQQLLLRPLLNQPAPTTNSWPTTWKTAKVILFPKPGKDATDPQNYRPMSLLSTISKVAEKIIIAKLNTHLEQHNTLPDQQFGFRPRHSTTHDLVRITEHITTGFNKKHKKQYTAAVFLETAKAFDRVWHEGLLYKLHTINLPDCYTRLLASYLRDRTFYTSLLGAQSEAVACPAHHYNRRTCRPYRPTGRNSCLCDIIPRRRGTTTYPSNSPLPSISGLIGRAAFPGPEPVSPRLQGTWSSPGRLAARTRDCRSTAPPSRLLLVKVGSPLSQAERVLWKNLPVYCVKSALAILKTMIIMGASALSLVSTCATGGLDEVIPRGSAVAFRSVECQGTDRHLAMDSQGVPGWLDVAREALRHELRAASPHVLRLVGARVCRNSCPGSPARPGATHPASPVVAFRQD